MSIEGIPIRKLQQHERMILINALTSQLEAWNDSHPLSPEEEDLAIDAAVLLHTIQSRQVMIDMPED